jgi:hypothetical protein
MCSCATAMASGGGSSWQRRWHAAVALGGDDAQWKIQPAKAAAHRGSCGHHRRRRPVVAPRDGGDLPRHVKLLDRSRPKPTATAYGTSGRPKPMATAATTRPGSSRWRRRLPTMLLALLETRSGTERGGCYRWWIAGGLTDVRAAGLRTKIDRLN